MIVIVVAVFVAVAVTVFVTHMIASSRFFYYYTDWPEYCQNISGVRVILGEVLREMGKSGIITNIFEGGIGWYRSHIPRW